MPQLEDHVRFNATVAAFVDEVTAPAPAAPALPTMGP